MKIFLYFILLIFVTESALYAQTCEIKGRTYDRDRFPVEGVVARVKNTSTKTLTSTNGEFVLNVPCNFSTTLQFTHPSFQTKEILINPGSNFQLDSIFLNDLFLDTVTVTGDPRGIVQKLPKIEAKLFPTITNNVEDFIKTFGLGVRSNNEMSATYNVRGGNFDENLIYVNDIEIYRPFLVRAGQQEGLSFINADLVEDIYFSSGGFEAKYDDRLSSVLDIKYRRPTGLKGTVSGGLLGGNVHLENVSKNHRFTWTGGLRYQANSYILNTLDTDGEYKPRFTDFQTLLTYAITDQLEISWLNYYARNNYSVFPKSRETDFGTVSQALRLTVYYEGREINLFQTFAQGITLKYDVNKTTQIKWVNSWFHNDEQENYDVLAAYRLGDVEQDPGDENFGEVVFIRGVGGYLEHARNRLKSDVINSKILFNKKLKKSNFSAGIKAQYNSFNDVISEWNLIDSAGFSTPQVPADQIILNYTLKAKANISSYLFGGFFQNRWRWNKTEKVTFKDSTFNSTTNWEICAGVRTNYLTLNEEFTVGPRFAVIYTPSWFKEKNDRIRRRNIIFHLASGVYYQPPLYRELRGFDGNLNLDLKAQRSIHGIFGMDYFFTMWGRTFKYSAEAYYKYLTNIVPYEVDNVRIRYYANNNAKGYATGLDMKVNGEFIKGIESWATFSLLSTKEDISDDKYTLNYNSDNEVIIPGYTFNDSIVKSVDVFPGKIPRPTDQILSLALYFQDEMPGLEQFKVNLSLLFASGVPFGYPDEIRYKDTLRGPFYRRVDIGFSYELFANKEKLRQGSIGHKIDKAYISLQVFNILGVSNTISYNWIEDTSGLQYAVPNYLTGRRFNLKFIVKF